MAYLLAFSIILWGTVLKFLSVGWLTFSRSGDRMDAKITRLEHI